MPWVRDWNEPGGEYWEDDPAPTPVPDIRQDTDRTIPRGPLPGDPNFPDSSGGPESGPGGSADPEPTPVPPPPPTPTRPTRRLPPDQRPANPGGGAVWNDDWWDGRSDYLGGYLVPEGTPLGPGGGPRGGPRTDPGPAPSYSFSSFDARQGPRANLSPVPQFTAPTFAPPPDFTYDKAPNKFVAPAPYVAPAPFVAPNKFVATPFVAPDRFVSTPFVAPTAADMANEPGFQFRMAQGQKALEQSASGRGVLRTGGTLKDLVGYGQNFASNEYGNVYNRRAGEYERDFNQRLGEDVHNYDRSVSEYDRNYNQRLGESDRDYTRSVSEYDRTYKQNLGDYERTYAEAVGDYDRDFAAFKFDYDKEADIYAKNYNVKRDTFDRDFQGKVAEFQPRLTGWQTNSSADQRAAEMSFGREWDQYVFGNAETWRNKNYDYQKRKDELDRIEAASRPPG